MYCMCVSCSKVSEWLIMDVLGACDISVLSVVFMSE